MLTGDPSAFVPGMRLTTSIPFVGTPELLWARPTRRALAARFEMAASRNQLIYVLEQTRPNSHDVESDLRARRESVTTHIESVTLEVESWRAQTFRTLTDAARQHRELLAAVAIVQETLTPDLPLA